MKSQRDVDEEIFPDKNKPMALRGVHCNCATGARRNPTAADAGLAPLPRLISAHDSSIQDQDSTARVRALKGITVRYYIRADAVRRATALV